jgi:CxxC motif-containing protein (DUF1111 family)
MKQRVTLLAVGMAIGVVLAGAGLWGYREYRRNQVRLSEAEQSEQGASDFGTPGDSATGMGPGFNAPSCGSCHNIPAMGGWGTATTLRVARRDVNGEHHSYEGGPFVPLFSNDHECQAVIPADANIFARRLTTSTFGSGLVDAIPDEVLIALEDPRDLDGDGVRGRAARVHDVASGRTRVGRFGVKAQQASLLAFAAEAYVHEIGVTNELFPVDRVLGVSAERIRLCDDVRDPEDRRAADTGVTSIEMFTAFMRSLPAPEPAPGNATTAAGGGHFERVGCAACHRPAVATARAYSDFLLHDVGTGDGIREGDAGPGEMRTAPLWGIRLRRLFLHDGSATSIDEAIARHAGEAASARDRFRALAPEDRRQLVAFVASQ